MAIDKKQYEQFLEALHRNEGTLVRICCTFTDRRPDHIADLYQDIVAVLWKHWSSFRGESALNTWITRVALNIACQQQRDRRRQPHFVHLDETLCSLIAAEADDGLYDQLYHLISLLEPDERKLIFLYLDRHPVHDIAATLRISETAVKKRIQRVKERLKQLKRQIYD